MLGLEEVFALAEFLDGDAEVVKYPQHVFLQLPVEIEVEKELKISGKEQIEQSWCMESG